MCLAFLPKLPIAYYATSFQTVARVTEAVKARPTRATSNYRAESSEGTY